MKKIILYAAALFITGLSFAAAAEEMKTGFGGDPALPKPFATEATRRLSKVIGWPEGATPQAPPGFRVTRFAAGLDNPRWIFELPNGDVLVAQAKTGGNPLKRSPNNIIRLRDADGDGVAEETSVFLKGLTKPFGMALAGEFFYVANMDGVVRYSYKEGISGEGVKILGLPTGGYNHHWTRNIIAAPDGKKLYVTVGSASNVGEGGMNDEKRRANIIEINADGTGEKIFASGLRNPVGMGWEPVTGKLWTAVNERDNLGDDLVPDYFTRVEEGAFYGWPYYYFGKNPDPRWNIGKPVSNWKVTKPDYALGAHTASLGLAFYTGKAFPAKYQGGAFIGQHGSWNRSEFAGYKVIFVPFSGGKPAGSPQDFLTGFMKDAKTGEAYGRPVGVAMLHDGSMLVADDAGNAVWHVAAEKSVK